MQYEIWDSNFTPHAKVEYQFFIFFIYTGLREQGV